MTRPLFLALALSLAACPNPGEQGAAQVEQAIAQEMASADPADDAGDPSTAPGVDQLRGLLRPIDSPLPDRAALEALVQDPATVLSTLLDDPDYLVRQNAARSLGLFADIEGVPETLFTMATNEGRSATERTAAVEGISRMPTNIREAHRGVLEGLVRGQEPAAAFAAVRALSDLSSADVFLEGVAADEAVHPAVRRRAKQATGTTSE